MRLRRLALAACLLLAAGAAAAAEPPPGTKNFTPPSSTPDYFSGEGGSFRGAAPRPVSPAPVAPAYAAPSSAAPTYTAPRYAAPERSRGVVEERRHIVRYRIVHAAGRRGHGRVVRRVVAFRGRHEERRGGRIAERRRAVSAHHASVRSRPSAHHTAARVHAAAGRTRKIARAGR